MNLAALALAALVGLSPRPSAHPLPGWDETPEDHRIRLERIADDVGAVARTPAEVAILVGIAWHESGIAPDVDAGACYRERGWSRRCDGGRAVSLWQLQSADPERLDVWRRDRRAAATEALRRALQSMRACQAGPRLAMYAGGACHRGHQAALELDESIRRARRMMEAAP